MKRQRTSYKGQVTKRPQKRQRTTPTVAALARQVALSANEKKYNDMTLNQDANSTSVETPLTTFATGDTVLLRDGNKALIKSVHVKCRLTNSSLTQSNVVRFVLVCDKLAQAEQCIWGAAGSVADVFDAATVVARRNILSAERFVVLMDEVVVINAASGTGGAPSMAYFERFVKIPQSLQIVAWSGASATIPVKNAYTLMYLGSTAAGVSDVNVEGTVRVRFCDK